MEQMEDQRMTNQTALLEQALEFIEGYEDVTDGRDGRPQPNRAMVLTREIRAALTTPQADKVPAAEPDHVHLAWRGALKACGVSEADRDAISEVVQSILATPPAKLPQEAQPVEFSMVRGTCTISGPKEDVLFISALIGEPDAAPQPARAGAVELTAEEIRGAIARGYCHQTNAKKVIDYDLLDAIAQEVCSLITAATTAATGEKAGE